MSRTNATPRDPNMIASSSLQSFTTTPAGGGTPPPPGGPVPSPWLTQDVGSVGAAGSASYSNGVFTVAGAGADIWGTADAFRYVYQGTSGDAQIVARVASIQNTNTYAKAGVMLRESLAAGAAHVILDVKPDGSVEFMTRSASNGSTTFLGSASQAQPTWLKLARSGSTVTGYVSSNGSTWTTVGSTTISIASSAYTGFLVNSHNTGALNTSTFDNVALTAGTTPPPTSAPGTPTSPSPANGATGVSATPTLTWSASGATSYDVRFGTANPPPQVATGQTSASYAPASLAANTTYYWQVVAKNSSRQHHWAGLVVYHGCCVGGTADPVDAPGRGLHRTRRQCVVRERGVHRGRRRSRHLGRDRRVPLRVADDLGRRAAGRAGQRAPEHHQWAKAGIMLRQTLTANSAHVLLDVTPSGTSSS